MIVANQVACPQFTIPSRVTIARDCVKLYYSEKERLREMFKACQRISVTTDTWTSIQRINYLCLTAHFIDSEWKLHKKIINFLPISSHKGEAIGKAVEACLEHWGIEDKLFTVIVDNASSNDVACMHLSRMVRRTGCINDGKNLHVRCMAHIINLIVWDGIKQHGVCIDRVRNAVNHVKNSPARISRFKDLRVFSGLSLPDGEDLNDNERPPEEEDWKKVQRLTLFLKGFYILTKRISGSHYVTSNRGLSEISYMYNMLNKWDKSGDLNFQAMSIAIKQKFDKYWGNVNKMNKLIYVASILEPHCKFILVELSLIDMHGKEKVSKLANEVKDFTYTLFDEYRNMYTSSISQTVPLSTVAYESAFSTGGRTLDPFRRSLTPKMVQALICSQDWLRAKGLPIIDVEETLKELEEIEKDVQCGDVDNEVIFVDSLV
uniref:Transposase n=1 Tax=Chenopodium quinoa TaxID=63459 RepID=A0A803MBI4_CHEQI